MKTCSECGEVFEIDTDFEDEFLYCFRCGNEIDDVGDELKN